MAFCPLFEELEGLSLEQLVNDYGAEIVVQAEQHGSSQIAIKIGGTVVRTQEDDTAEPMGFQCVTLIEDDEYLDEE